MRLQTITRIRCDNPTCGNHIDMVTPPDRQFYETLQAAVLSAGWSAVGDLGWMTGIIYCPGHAATPPAANLSE